MLKSECSRMQRRRVDWYIWGLVEETTSHYWYSVLRKEFGSVDNKKKQDSIVSTLLYTRSIHVSDLLWLPFKLIATFNILCTTPRLSWFSVIVSMRKEEIIVNIKCRSSKCFIPLLQRGQLWDFVGTWRFEGFVYAFQRLACDSYWAKCSAHANSLDACS